MPVTVKLLAVLRNGNRVERHLAAADYFDPPEPGEVLDLESPPRHLDERSARRPRPGEPAWFRMFVYKRRAMHGSPFWNRAFWHRPRRSRLVFDLVIDKAEIQALSL